MITRRQFLGRALAAASICTSVPAAAGAAIALRSVTYNLRGCVGWLGGCRGGPGPSAEVMERMAEGLSALEPDIISVSEAPGEESVSHMARKLGMAYAMFNSPGRYRGALFTRLPIEEAQNRPLAEGRTQPAGLFLRHFGRVVLAAPGGPIVLYAAQLDSRRRMRRSQEIAAILEVMQPDLRANANVLLQGDFGHTPQMGEYAHWEAAGLIDAYAARGTGVDGTVLSWEPRHRVDYIWMHGPIAKRLMGARSLSQIPFRYLQAKKSRSALSDHLPVVAAFRAEAPETIAAE